MVAYAISSLMARLPFRRELHRGLHRLDGARVERLQRSEGGAQELPHHGEPMLGNGYARRTDAVAQLFHTQLLRVSHCLSFASPRRSRLQGEFLEGVTVRGRVPPAHREGPGHLAHVDVALRVHRDAVRRREVAGSARLGPAPAREHAALGIEDAHPPGPRLRDGPLTTRGLARVPPQLGDEGAALGVEDEVGRTLGVRPLAQILALGAEDLDAIVLAVADEDPAVGSHGDAVGQIERAGARARHAPGALALARRREAVDTAVAVA